MRCDNYNCHLECNGECLLESELTLLCDCREVFDVEEEEC
jgi:hypothetical protein